MTQICEIVRFWGLPCLKFSSNKRMTENNRKMFERQIGELHNQNMRIMQDEKNGNNRVGENHREM